MFAQDLHLDPWYVGQYPIYTYPSTDKQDYWTSEHSLKLRMPSLQYVPEKSTVIDRAVCLPMVTAIGPLSHMPFNVEGL